MSFPMASALTPSATGVVFTMGDALVMAGAWGVKGWRGKGWRGKGEA